MLKRAPRILYPVGTEEESEASADERLTFAREHFSYYRELMNPRMMLKGMWFPLRIAR